MNKKSNKSKSKKVEEMTADERLHVYANDPFFLKKREEAKKIFAKGGYPNELFLKK